MGVILTAILLAKDAVVVGILVIGVGGTDDNFVAIRLSGSDAIVFIVLDGIRRLSHVDPSKNSISAVSGTKIMIFGRGGLGNRKVAGYPFIHSAICRPLQVIATS